MNEGSSFNYLPLAETPRRDFQRIVLFFTISFSKPFFCSVITGKCPTHSVVQKKTVRHGGTFLPHVEIVVARLQLPNSVHLCLLLLLRSRDLTRAHVVSQRSPVHPGAARNAFVPRLRTNEPETGPLSLSHSRIGLKGKGRRSTPVPGRKARPRRRRGDVTGDDFVRYMGPTACCWN